jgi:NTP pyrophosphatase (non-canonical NTP hydrolase)/DNA-directed RNA polymerase subunit RPC12/RpoP
MNIYEEALDTWGEAPQIAMLAEECTELAAAALHLLRGREAKEEVAEEAADVEIMLQQLRLIMGDEIDEWKRKKIHRLRHVLDRVRVSITQNGTWRVTADDMQAVAKAMNSTRFIRYECGSCGEKVRVNEPGKTGDEYADTVLEISCPRCGGRMRPVPTTQSEERG